MANNKGKTITVTYTDSKGNDKTDYFFCDKNYILDKDNAQLVEAIKTALDDVGEIMSISERLDKNTKYTVRFLIDDKLLREEEISGENDKRIGEIINDLSKDINENDYDKLKIDIVEKTTPVAESFTEEGKDEYIIWSASDLTPSDKQIPLVKLVPNTEGTESVTYDVYKYIDFDENFVNPFTGKIEKIKNKLDEETGKIKLLNKENKYEYFDIDELTLDPETKRLKEPIEQTSQKTITIPPNAPFIAKAISDSKFDMESERIANDVIRTAYANGKNPRKEDVLLRIDKTLNHNDPFFSVEFDRSITNPGSDILASQTLRTIRDDLKAAANLGSATEDSIVAKYAELTGVDYYTDKVVNKDQYDTILKLQGRAVDRDRLKYYEAPADNEYMQRFKDLAEDLIEKVLLKTDPDFYNK